MTSPADAGEPLSPERASLQRALAGQYEIERELGRGGMGVVHLARDLKLHRQVAIKVLPPSLAAQPVVRERFLREARIAAQLSHPNIVPVHRADEIDGIAFFVMGYVDGESLGERVRRVGPLDPVQVARMLRDVALALGFAHAHGIVHRDVKPENILIERDSGRPMVTDFGVARLVEASPLTSVGLVLGTVHYMSPEQAASDAVDGRSDLYSLGVVAFQALSGTLPFEGVTAAAVIVALATRPAPSLIERAPHVPRALAAVVDRCLAKHAEDRYASGQALAAAFDEAIVAANESHTPAKRAPAERMISERDAEWLWQRAAELQAIAHDGTEAGGRSTPRAPTPPVATPYEGYRLHDVGAAATEAGISRQYVALALDEMRAERGLVAPTSRVPTTINDRTSRSIIAGGPTSIELEMTIPGELPGDAFEEMIDTIRREVGEMGQVATLGHSLAWSVDTKGRKLHITFSPRGGHTTIRINERMAPIIGGIFGGVVGGGGGGFGGVTLGVIMGTTHSAPLALGAWGGIVLLAYGVARGVFGVVAGRRKKKLRALLTDLSAQASEAIAARDAMPRLPSSSSGR